MTRTMIAMLLAAGLALPAVAAPSLPSGVTAEGKAVISRSEQFVFNSKAAGKAFRIQVSEPVRPMKPGEKAAVVYVLDGNYAFGMAADIARNSPQMGEMAHAYIVGVGYPDDTQLGWDLGREHDYIHTAADLHENGKLSGGGGPAFQKFLVEELRPFIEARYPIENGKAFISGHSLGGLFLVNMMISRPEAFDGYSVGSPALFVDKTVLERAKGAVGKGAGRKVYIGVEGVGAPPGFVEQAIELGDILTGPGSTWKVERRHYKDETHITIQGALFANAMHYLAPWPEKPK